jgi:protein ImuB
MAFASIFVPNFMVQAVVRSEPGLRDRALALVDGTSSIQTVIGLNEAASKAGVKLSMTKSQAQQFGEIEVRHRSRRQEKVAHAALLDLGWSVSPRGEDTAADTIVLDLAGLACLFGSEESIAGKLAEGATHLGFTTQIATASNPDAAILASRAFAGITVIPAGEESTLIGKAPASALSPSTEVRETLERWGVHTCAALAALPVLGLSERLGQEGVRLHEWARARSMRAMVPAQPGIYFEEAMELEQAVAEIEPLAFLLGRLLGQLCARLAERSLAAGAIRVRFELEPSLEFKIRNSKFETRGDKEFRVVEDNRRPEPGPNIYERTLSLALPMSDSTKLLKLLILHLQTDAPSAPVLRIILAAEAARLRVSQGGLFSPISPDPEKVELTMARPAKIVGAANIGSPELLDTHRPEGFRMLRFVPNRDSVDTRRPIRRSPRGQGATIKETAENLSAAVGAVELNPRSRRAGWVGGSSLTPVPSIAAATGRGVSRSSGQGSVPPGLRPGLSRRGGTAPDGAGEPLKTALRVFRPALPARVEVRQGCPARVAFPGIRGRVVAASGPWRCSGDWWSEDAWQSAEWDIEIQFDALPHLGSSDNPGLKGGPQGGVYRLFYDLIRQAWFVRGAYD